MNQHTYYMSWHTWREDPVETPWDFWYLSKGEMPQVKQSDVDLEQIQKIWQNQDVKAWEALQQHNIQDVRLAAFVEADTEDSAKAQVLALFPDAVWHKCVLVDGVTKQQIIQLFGDTLSKAA
jgi:hypothetical protein